MDCLSQTYAFLYNTMNTEHVVSPKDSSLKKGDFEMIRTLKLNQFEELNPNARCIFCLRIVVNSTTSTPSGSNAHRIVMQSSASAVFISENSGAWMEGE